MRLASLIKKTTLENLRDWKILVITLTFAPFFAVLMYFYFDAATVAPHRVAVVNTDTGSAISDGSVFRAGEELLGRMSAATDVDGDAVLKLSSVSDEAEARESLDNGSVDLVVVIPAGFSSILLEYQTGAEPPSAVVRSYGDPSNSNYLIAAAWSDAITYMYAAEVVDLPSPLEVDVQTVGAGHSFGDFHMYVPSLMTLALICLMFTAAATLIKEKDKGTILRLRISNMTTFEWLLAVTTTQLVLGLLAVLATLVTAMALGYEATFSIPALALVTIVSSLSVIAISVVVAAWLRTIFDLMTIGCFPFFILMFFSGSMFPLPPVRVFELAGRSVNVTDILPTTHSMSAFTKVLNNGAGPAGLLFELIAILLLSTAFYAFGTWLFTKRHMQARNA